MSSNVRLGFLRDGGPIPPRTKRRHSMLFSSKPRTSAVSECDFDCRPFELFNASSDSDIVNSDVDDVTEPESSTIEGSNGSDTDNFSDEIWNGSDTDDVSDDGNHDPLFDEDSITDRIKDVGGESSDFLEYCVPLYPNASKTVFEYHVETYQFALKHNLTKVAYQDLLNLIPHFLPSSNLAIKSLCKLKGLFSSIWNRDVALSKHRYCSICHNPLTKDEKECSNKCGQAIEHFVLCDIEVQLRTFMSGNDYVVTMS